MNDTDRQGPHSHASGVPRLDPGEHRIQVKDFGPIAEADIDLRPLTVFIGPSNTGKSYLAMLIYAWQKYFEADRARLDGNSADWWQRIPNGAKLIPDAASWLAERARDRTDPRHRAPSATLTTDLDEVPEPFVPLFRAAADASYDPEECVEEIQRCIGWIETDSLVRRSAEQTRVRISRTFGDEGSSETYSHELAFSKEEPSGAMTASPGLRLWIDPNRVNLLGSLIGRLGIGLGYRQSVVRRDGLLMSPATLTCTLGALSRAAHYLPADRSGVMNAHRTLVGATIYHASLAGIRRESPPLPGVLADFLQRLVHAPGHSSPNRSKFYGNLPINLAEKIEESILGGDVLVKRESRIDYPSFLYRPGGWETDIPLAQSSSMVAEVAPVVLYLRHVVQPGDTLIIEEPESHMHPALQVRFTHELARLVTCGVRLILTTHSDWILSALANLVRMAGLPQQSRAELGTPDLGLTPADVGAWMFEHDQELDGTVTRELIFDCESGMYDSGYPDVSNSLYNEWVAIADRLEDDR